MSHTGTPITTVFSTPELLEDILLRLDMRILLLSQRVNRAFNATINSSSEIQGKLFLNPIATGTKYPCTEDNCIDMCHQADPTRSHLNPILISRSIVLLDSPPSARCSPTAILTLQPTGDIELCAPLRTRSAGTALETASWRPMLLQQPPTRIGCDSQRGVRVSGARTGALVKAARCVWPTRASGGWNYPGTVEGLLQALWPEAGAGVRL